MREKDGDEIKIKALGWRPNSVARSDSITYGKVYLTQKKQTIKIYFKRWVKIKSKISRSYKIIFKTKIC
jgi:hypothetical protein